MVADPKTYRLVVGLGANLGDRKSALLEAVRRLEAPDLHVLGRSNIYETRAVGPAQPDFLNAAVLVQTSLSPRAVLERALDVERSLGRQRPDPIRWGPRPIDIDILWAEGIAIDEPGLTIPHPCLIERAFALRPLLDVAPDAQDPRTRVRYAEAAEAHAELVPVGAL